MKYEAKTINRVAQAIALISVVILAVGATVSVAPSFVCAQAAPATCPNFGLERTTTYNLQDAAYAYGYAVATDDANNIYVTGEQYAPATGLDMYVIKYDQNGNTVWSDVYDIGGNESGYGITVDAAGNNIYVVGRQQDNASLNSDAFVRKYDVTGAAVWTQVYNFGGADIARGAALDGVGNIYAVGYREKTTGDIEAMLLSYNASGGLQFVVPYAAANNASAFGIAVSGGDVYVTGYTQPTTNDTDMFVRKYTTGGVFVWGQTYNSVSYTAVPKAQSILVTGATWAYCPIGSTVVSATDTGQGDNHGINSSTTGCQAWEGSPNDITTTDPWGNPIVTPGYAQCTFTCSVYTELVLNGDLTDIGYGVAVDSTGSVFVTGYQDTNGGNSFLRKYDAAGNLMWGEEYNSGGAQNDVGRGVVAGNSRRIFVTGRQQTNNEDAFSNEYYKPSNVNCGTNDHTYNSTSFSPPYSYFCGAFDADATIALGGKAIGQWISDYNVYEVHATPVQEDLINGFIWFKRHAHGQNGSAPTDAFWKIGINTTGIISETYYSNPYSSLYQYPVTQQYNLMCNEDRTSCTLNLYSLISGGNPCSSSITFNPLPAYSCPAGLFACFGAPLQCTPQASLISSYLYRGDQAGAAEYNEMAFGVAVTPSSVPPYVSTANDVYVVGYQGSNGGEAFLNKYSCNAAQAAAVGASLIANFTATPTSGPDPLTVNVDARASAGTVEKYEWDWDYDGITFNVEDTGSLTSHIYDVSMYAIPGAYTIALRITTSSNTTDIATQIINVSQNQPPAAGFTVCDVNNSNCVPPATAPFTGVAPLRVNVDGAASTDPNAPQGGYVESFSWDWGDGTIPGVGEKATHLYSAPGSYTITLTVTDNGGLVNIIPATQTISVVAQYVCTSGAGPGGSCAVPTPVCGPTETGGGTQCYECLADNNCGAGYQCLGTPCTAGTQCSDGALCPADGKCPEIVTCNPLASGATCPDGSLCPTNGICPAAKNICTLSGSAVDTDCYIEEQGSCVIDADCTESITGGVCDAASGACRYARCSNDTALACITDNDCASGDGICNSGSCVYIYDCAYGPGLGGGVVGLYATSTPDVMPKMPLGVQPDGQACTQPTADAPNNCEGINGCLYYNYYSGSGTAIPNSNNSVANCINTFEGGTGCVYYQYYDGATQTEKANCLPRYAEKSKKPPQAGIPAGCFVVDKGARGKEYNCTAIDGCYYYLGGEVDCTYKEVTATTCMINAECAAAAASPLMIPTCNGATGLCEYQGNGCIYEPNPKGAISCPGATNPATGGKNFVQCMLNPDGVLPGFLNTSGNALDSCSVNADCPVGNICLNGTCYPQCQANVNCASGEQCTTTCTTSLDCTAGLVCNAGVCVPPLCAGGTPAGTLLNVTAANLGLVTSTDSNCRYSTDSADPYIAMTPFTTTNTTSHSEPLNGLFAGSYAYYVLCQELSSGVLAGLCQINFDIADKI